MTAALLLALALPAAALDIEREEYAVIGWDAGCGVAVERYAYPVFGQAIAGEPVVTRVGTLLIAPGQNRAETRWVLEADGPNTWDQGAIARAKRELRKKGFDRPGYPEIIRDAPMADAPGTRDILLSTATLAARPDFWPDAEWRWSRAHYNPLTTCALLVFEKIGEKARFKFLPTRIYNPAVRDERARAHAANGRLLFDAGDLEGALAETEIAAALAPEIALVRYHHAASLSLTGRFDRAMVELKAAVKLDRRYAARAAEDLDFESMRPRQDFQALIARP